MKTKPKTPYQRLLEALRKAWDLVEFPHRKLMWRYPDNKITEQWTLGDLTERTRAADQIGYDTVLSWNDSEGVKGLEVWYRKRPPQRPSELL